MRTQILLEDFRVKMKPYSRFPSLINAEQCLSDGMLPESLYCLPKVPYRSFGALSRSNAGRGTARRFPFMARSAHQGRPSTSKSQTHKPCNPLPKPPSEPRRSSRSGSSACSWRSAIGGSLAWRQKSSRREQWPLPLSSGNRWGSGYSFWGILMFSVYIA